MKLSNIPITPNTLPSQNLPPSPGYRLYDYTPVCPEKTFGHQSISVYNAHGFMMADELKTAINCR
jgi:hypothetical protein